MALKLLWLSVTDLTGLFFAPAQIGLGCKGIAHVHVCSLLLLLSATKSADWVTRKRFYLEFEFPNLTWNSILSHDMANSTVEKTANSFPVEIKLYKNHSSCQYCSAVVRAGRWLRIWRNESRPFKKRLQDIQSLAYHSPSLQEKSINWGLRPPMCWTNFLSGKL